MSTPTLNFVDPKELLLERNVRLAKADKGLIESIKAVGLLEPITAVKNSDGALVVRFGHRRTLAAIQARVKEVPVLVVGEDSVAARDEVRRLITQYDENTYREGLSAADEVGFVESLSGLGLKAGEIAKQARLEPERVDAALRISGSEAAKKHLTAPQAESFSFEHLAAFAEFEDDQEALDALWRGIEKDQFEHTLQKCRDCRDEAASRAQVLACLAEAGVTVIDAPGYEEPGTRPLDRLVVSADDDTRLSEVAHGDCAGHVAWITSGWVRVNAEGEPLVLPEEPSIEEPEAPYDLDDFENYVYALENPCEDEDLAEAVDPRSEVDAAVLAAYDAAYAAYRAEWDAWEEQVGALRSASRQVQRPVAAYGCQNWREHGHADRYSYGGSTPKVKASDMSEEERAAAKAARRLVIENNKAWAAAQPVRREWIASFSKVKIAPKGTSAFIATALSRDAEVLHHVGGNQLAAEWLGKKSASGYGAVDLSPAKSTSEQRALVVALVQVLAGYEDDLMDNTWRRDGTNAAAGRYLRFLAALGYTLSDVEKFAISSKNA